MVVAVIALLIGLLVPTLERTRRSAQLMQDYSNLRQLSLASMAYTTDFERFPIPDMGLIGNFLYEPVGYAFGGMTPAPELANSSAAEFLYYPEYARPINGYLYTDIQPRPWDGVEIDAEEDRRLREEFISPQDDQFLPIYDLFGSEVRDGRSSWEAYGTSYVANTWFVASPGFDVRLTTNMTRDEMLEVLADRIDRMSRSMLLNENPSRLVVTHEHAIEVLRSNSRVDQQIGGATVDRSMFPGLYSNEAVVALDNAQGSLDTQQQDYLCSFADGSAKLQAIKVDDFLPGGWLPQFESDDFLHPRPASGPDYTFGSTVINKNGASRDLFGNDI